MPTTDKLRRFVYRSPEDGDLYWTCRACGDEVHESIAPTWYGRFSGEPYCPGCYDAFGSQTMNDHLTPQDKADLVEAHRATYDTEES